MHTEEDVLKILRRTFKAGGLRRLPRKREDADVVMALSVAGLDPDGIYEESDINLHLSAWLQGIAVDNGHLDRVTLRRCLVDYDFLRRASDGVIYRLRAERIDEVLTPQARKIDPKAIFAEVEAKRADRRAAFRRH